MKLALLSQAIVTHDTLSAAMNSDGWELENHLQTSVSPQVKQAFTTNTSIRQAFTNVFKHIAMVIDVKSVPRPDRIVEALSRQSEQPPVTKSFYDIGGTPEMALYVIFKGAKDQDEMTGDGMHQKMFEEKIKKLPACRNDLEFDFVALVCGVKLE